MRRKAGPVVVGRMMLWPTITCAHAYAHARFIMYSRRQRVVPVRHEGRVHWRVVAARPGRETHPAGEVSEPCS